MVPVLYCVYASDVSYIITGSSNLTRNMTLFLIEALLSLCGNTTGQQSIIVGPGTGNLGIRQQASDLDADFMLSILS